MTTGRSMTYFRNTKVQKLNKRIADIIMSRISEPSFKRMVGPELRADAITLIPVYTGGVFKISESECTKIASKIINVLQA